MSAELTHLIAGARVETRHLLAQVLRRYEALHAEQSRLNFVTRSLLASMATPPPSPPDPAARVDLPRLLSQYERALVVWALERSRGQQQAASRLLGIRPSTLNEKMKRLGIARPLAAVR